MNVAGVVIRNESVLERVREYAQEELDALIMQEDDEDTEDVFQFEE